jgi:uncharacterized protein (DUF305 family)
MYLRLLLMTVLSFISMFVLMYMMVNEYDDVFANLNQAYMAAIMTAPMVLFELILMGSMYKNRKINIVLGVVAAVVLVVFSYSIRKQTAIEDKEFLRSMIPHHGGAVLMCKNAEIQDQEIKELCQTIISSQESEIGWMKKKLNELNR